MNFIFESSSVLKDVHMYVCCSLRRITLLINMARIAGCTLLCCKIISDFKKNTETLIGDVFLFMLLLHGSHYCEDSCYIRIQKWQMWPVRQAICQDSRTVIVSWMVNADAESEERNDYNSSSHFFTDETWFSSLEFSDTRWEWQLLYIHNYL